MTMENTIRATAAVAERRLAVLLPLPLSGAYDYAIPEGIEPAPGDFLRVPLGSREVIGVAWGAATGEVGLHRLKPILGRLDVPLMPEVMRKFIDWVAQYTLTPPGAVLRMAMSVSAALEPPKPQLAYRRTTAEAETLGVRLTPARQRVLAVLADGPPRNPLELAREAGVTPAVVKGLAQSGAIEQIELPARPPFGVPEISRAGVTHSPDQRIAVEALRAQAEKGGFNVTLLDGVTGSGKTEVYFEAIAAALAAGRQALVLVPEIALTSQWLARFRNRFSVEPAQWHSDLSASQRRIAWRAVAEGRVHVLVGARSALFLPF